MIDQYLSDIHKRIEEGLKDETTCCKKGCSFCCHQFIDLFEVEIEDIKNYLKNSLDTRTKNIIKHNIINWLDHFNKNTSHDRILTGTDLYIHYNRKMADDKIPCPLLIDDKCSIYEIRPIVCRIHYVESSPEKCEIDPLRNSEPVAKKLKRDLMYEIAQTDKSGIFPLPYAIATVFLPKRGLKEITATRIKLTD